MIAMSSAKAQSNKKTILLTTVVVIMFVSALAGVVAWYYGQSAERQKKSESTQTVAPEKAPIDPEAAKILDRDLVKRLLVHDQQAIELFDIELSRGESPALKKLVGEMKTTRQAQIVKTEALLKKWNEPYTNLSEYPQQSGHDMYPSHPGMATPEELTKLRAEPTKSVDAMFFELMTTHYSGSISILQGHKDDAVDEDVKSLISSALEARSDEQSDLDMHQSMHSKSGSQH